MNAVWNSYGQLCGCPEIFKKSCKFFCRELDIRVTQVVEADRTQTVFLQQLRELLGNVVGADDVPDLVHTQIAQILPVVAFTAQAAVGVLLTFQHQQAVTDGRHKGQRPQTGFRFCAVCLHQNLFAVDGCLRDDVLDLQRVGFKVDGIPWRIPACCTPCR